MATKRELRKVTEKSGDGKSPKKNKLTSIDPADIRLLKSILTILIVFLMMWSPYAIIVVFDKNATWSRSLYVVAVVLAHLNSSANSVLYAATNKNFREGYAHLLSLFFCSALFCCRRKKDGVASSSNSSNIISTVTAVTQASSSVDDLGHR